MHRLRPCALALLAALACAAPLSTGTARELKPVTGAEWTSATEREQKAFLHGMGTMIQLEHNLAVQQRVPEDRTSFVPTFVRGLEGMTFVDIKTYLDTYYRTHPDQMNRPVVDILWADLALPRAQQAQR